MKIYEYKCISLTLNLNLEIKSHSDSANAYQNILNEACRDGWEFIKIDTIIPAPNADNIETYLELKEEKVCVKVFIFRRQSSVPFDFSSAENSALNRNKILCPSCQNEVSKDDLFCENCACKLK